MPGTERLQGSRFDSGHGGGVGRRAVQHPMVIGLLRPINAREPHSPWSRPQTLVTREPCFPLTECKRQQQKQKQKTKTAVLYFDTKAFMSNPIMSLRLATWHV